VSDETIQSASIPRGSADCNGISSGRLLSTEFKHLPDKVSIIPRLVFQLLMGMVSLRISSSTTMKVQLLVARMYLNHSTNPNVLHS
jgi:hypothetical protein